MGGSWAWEQEAGVVVIEKRREDSRRGKGRERVCWVRERLKSEKKMMKKDKWGRWSKQAGSVAAPYRPGRRSQAFSSVYKNWPVVLHLHSCDACLYIGAWVWMCAYCVDVLSCCASHLWLGMNYLYPPCVCGGAWLEESIGKVKSIQVVFCVASKQSPAHATT